MALDSMDGMGDAMEPPAFAPFGTMTPDPVDPGDPNNPTQTYTYPLHLDTAAVVTLPTGLMTFRQVLRQAGPYPASISPSDGNAVADYVLTATGIPVPVLNLLLGAAEAVFPALIDGQVQDLSLPVNFTDGTISTDPDPGTGDGGDTGGGDTGGTTPALVDVDITLGSPVTDISMGSSILYRADGTEQIVHVFVQAVDSADGKDADYRSLSPTIAVVRGQPTEDDFQTGDWLTRTATTPAGTYASLDVSGMGLVRAPYAVWVQITVGGKLFVRKAPGLLIVR